MSKYQLRCLFFIITQPFLWYQISVSAAPIKSTYNWNGFYLGAIAGGASSRFNTDTSTEAGPLFSPSRADTINIVGNQMIETTDFLAGMEGGYNWQKNKFFLGIEADIQSLSTNGETNSGAIPEPNNMTRQFVITSYANNNWLFTVRPRLGLTADRWLFYVTGGLGLTLLQSDFIFSNNAGVLESQRVSQIKPGYVLGAGIETGLTNHVSLKAEYLFENFSNTNASNMNSNLPLGQTISNSVSLKSNTLRLGVNYHFNDEIPDLSFTPELFDTSLWKTEIGLRLFLSTGVDGAPQPLLNSDVVGNRLASRLTFSNLEAIAEETYARIDHASGLFAKAYLGAGSVTNGQLNDEDFPAGGTYSNTLSDVLGNLSYATIDFGYSFIRTSFAKTGLFVGYNYYAQNLNVYDCSQIAGALVCTNPNEFTNFLGISEDDRYKSLRVGFSSQFNLTNQLTFTSEAAYLPIVNFKGTDIHNARQLIGPERANRGDGAMLESILDYQFAEAWALGLGWRYWMWNMHNGSLNFDFLGTNGSIAEPARFNTERYGIFLQLNYREKKSHSLDMNSLPISWKGIVMGGHLGGAWGKSDWSDPFNATNALGGLTNVAGFGDQIRSTGSLGGIDINYNWQADKVVYGVGASMSAADIRGENTLFSGIGGINGQTTINYLGTVVGKIGTTLNRSLFYINAGRALLNTTYSMNGNTNALSLGAGSETINSWGWTAGAGVEYALTNHWVSNVEYDYIHVPSRTLSVSSIVLINSQRITANQSINVFKVGLNYKFDIFT